MAPSPSDLMVLRQVHDGSYRDRFGSGPNNMSAALADLEQRGLVYLSPAGYGLTDAGRTAILGNSGRTV